MSTQTARVTYHADTLSVTVEPHPTQPSGESDIAHWLVTVTTRKGNQATASVATTADTIPTLADVVELWTRQRHLFTPLYV